MGSEMTEEERFRHGWRTYPNQLGDLLPVRDVLLDVEEYGRPEHEIEE